MPDPDLEIRGGEEGMGGGGHSDPVIRGGEVGGGGVQKGFSALRASVSLLHNRF